MSRTQKKKAKHEYRWKEIDIELSQHQKVWVAKGCSAEAEQKLLEELDDIEILKFSRLTRQRAVLE